MGTPTTKMNLTKPTIGGDTNWGTLVNNNYDIIDNLAGYNTVSVSVSGSLSVGNGPTLVKATGGVGGITLTLPDASTAANAGRVFIIVKVDAAAGAITVNTTGGQTINGAATASVPNQWDRLTVQGDGANWIVIDPVSVSGTFVSLAPAADQTITGSYLLTLDTGSFQVGGAASVGTLGAGQVDGIAIAGWTGSNTIGATEGISLLDVSSHVTSVPTTPITGLGPLEAGLVVGMEFDPGAVATTAVYASEVVEAFVPTTNSQPINSIFGSYVSTDYWGTGTVGGLNGTYAQCTSSAGSTLSQYISTGTFYTFNNSNNAVPSVYGVQVGAFHQGTGTATDLVGIDLYLGDSSQTAVITNATALRISSPGFAGTITGTDNISLKIDDPTAPGFTNNYAVKVTGKSYFTGVGTRVRTVNTATYTVVADDCVILADCATNTTSINITMPDPTTVKDTESASLFLIRRVDSSIVTYTVTISPHAAETFDGQTTILLPNQWDSVLLQSDGTNWHVLEYKFTALQNTGTFPQTVTDFAYGRAFLYDGCSVAIKYTNNPVYLQATPEGALSNTVGLYVDGPTNVTGYTGNPAGGSDASGVCGVYVGDQGSLGVVPGGGSNPYGAAGILIETQTNSSYAMITRGGRVWHQGDIYLSGHLNAGSTAPAANGDIAGVITVSNPATTATVTFTTAFTSAPVVVITPTADPTALGAYWVTSTTTNFTVHVTTTPGTTFDFNYMAMGNPN